MPTSDSHHVYRFGPFRYDKDEKSLLRDGHPQPARLKRMSLLLLEFFLRHPGQLVSREEIRGLLWPESKRGMITPSEENALDQQISLLRTELKRADGAETNYIASEKGKGFRFVAGVAEEGQRITLTVLPFRQSHKGRMTVDLEFEIRDALIRRLTLNPTLSVRHAELNLSTLEDSYDPISIGKELGVGKVITGAVFIQRNRLRLMLQLINTSGYYEQTPEPFEFNLADRLKAVEIIAAHIETALNASLPGRRKKRLAKRRTGKTS